MAGLSRDDVIAAIYAAATEPDALARIAYVLRNHIGADSAGIWLTDNGEITDISQTSDIEESIEPYIAYYQKLDPWAAAQKEPGQVFLGSDGVDEETLVESEFYRDFARHFGMLQPMGVTLACEPGVLATIAVNRTEARQLLGEPDRAVLQGLAVHIKGALALRSRILADREASAARGAALDQVSFGVVVCDEGAKVLVANAAAADLAKAGLIVFGGRSRGLAAAGSIETRKLQTLVRSAASARQPGAMRLEARSGVRVSVLVTPVLAEGRQRALVCLRRDDASVRADPLTLSHLFGFSPAQAELCCFLLGGMTFEEAAAARGIATSTARSYFLAILARTGAKNLRDLLRLLGTLPQIGPG